MKDSAIQWTDHTFNAWEGCTKVAPECKNCYAETLVDHRFARAKWGKGQPRRRTSASYWKQPLQWNQFYFPVCDRCEIEYAARHIESCNVACSNCHGGLRARRPRVFCLSLGDWLDEEVPIEWLADLLDLIDATSNLDWQLLTKRPQNWRDRVTAAEGFQNYPGDTLALSWINGIAPDNIWIGVSAGADQKAALEIPARIHFLSCEPMLHALDTTRAAGFDWIIFGGESGKNARHCDVDWIREGLAFCRANHIAAFVKQLGAAPLLDIPGRFARSNNPMRLNDSHGGDMSEWPEDLRVREFPQQSKIENRESKMEALRP